MKNRVLLEPHAHTKESSPCGWIPGAELITILHQAGYQAVVITDHYLPGRYETAEARALFLAGYRAARAAGEELGVTVLPGMEIRFKDHNEDFLVYGMLEEEMLALPDDVCDRGLRAFYGMAREKGWAVYQAHPFRPKMLPANPADIDGMETFNANPRHDARNRLTANFAALHNLRSIAGTDVHRPSDVGLAGIYVPPDKVTPRGLAQWLKDTPHPKVHQQEPTRDGIRFVSGAIPGKAMLEALYRDVGWTAYAEGLQRAMDGIAASARVVTAWDDTSLVGMARAVGDGHTILYVQDVAVLGTYRRRGIGRGLMERLLKPYGEVRQIVLLADENPETRGFYRALGFEDVKNLGCAAFLRRPKAPMGR